ncbi:alpha/beta-hydrolase [Guyanagaster necrorhizus]|uniref:carboxypeptidase C n=1 Tax=Guyanagaster necrorhizus TaxID=856835 RepID=A0A9P7VS18_9AGAR|nr:alpha/beta-hydrolase [Guyanagaster necrorhizus MCA 3950]KAG7445425.1 alpha/beta-hydrolase [Guyanagaster necrorhizus MCA 3950]
MYPDHSTNGGPGCSSSLGLFMELGPWRVLDSGGPKYNSYSWNTNANIFFIDQPIDIGFSYAEYGETVSTSEDATQNVAAFVTIFFSCFDQFKGRPFHIAGGSYGGRYLPLFASAVCDNNAKLLAAGQTPINLASVMIGNGITDSMTTFPSYFDVQCTAASVLPTLDIKTYVYMKSALPRCKKWKTQSSVDQFDSINCGAAYSFCSSVLSAPYDKPVRSMNPYDMSHKCDGDISVTLCYPMTKYILQYLDDPVICTLLGVDPSLTANSRSDFHAVQDTNDYVSVLLERGARVLIYAGTYDWICNWVGNERWTIALGWSGQREFAREELKEWYVDEKHAGKMRSAKGLTFATIDGAGQMLKESLAMVQRWLRGHDF